MRHLQDVLWVLLQTASHRDGGPTVYVLDHWFEHSSTGQDSAGLCDRNLPISLAHTY